MDIPWYMQVGLGFMIAMVAWGILEFFGSFTELRKAKAHLLEAQAKEIETRIKDNNS